MRSYEFRFEYGKSDSFRASKQHIAPMSSVSSSSTTTTSSKYCPFSAMASFASNKKTLLISAAAAATTIAVAAGAMACVAKNKHGEEEEKKKKKKCSNTLFVADQNEEGAAAAAAEEEIRVSDLFIYPIKSCKGIRVNSWSVCDKGFRYDRKWMVVSPVENRFITQRQKPRLCLVETALTEDGTLTISAPGMEPILVGNANDLEKKHKESNGERVYVHVWGDNCEAIDMGDEIAAWLTKFLETDCRLVMFPSDFTRPVEPEFTTHLVESKARTIESMKTGFADGYPFLMISNASLDGLNQRLEEKGEEALPMKRFRPNIVLTGCSQPHQEDSWEIIRIVPASSSSSNSSNQDTDDAAAGITFHCVKPCQRCTITTVNPETGVKGSQPLQELNQYRKSENKKLFSHGPLFGQNLVHEYDSRMDEQASNFSGGVRLSVGDRIVVVKRRSQQQLEYWLKGGEQVKTTATATATATASSSKRWCSVM